MIRKPTILFSSAALTPIYVRACVPEVDLECCFTIATYTSRQPLTTDSLTLLWKDDGGLDGNENIREGTFEQLVFRWG